jgi:RimJ/RimL family protein N-acetyltransferase
MMTTHAAQALWRTRATRLYRQLAAAGQTMADARPRRATLRTSRLILRPWRERDRAPFARLNADPMVMQHFPHVLSRAQSDVLMDRLQTHVCEQGWGLWAVEIPGVTCFAGFIGLSRPRFEAHFTPCVEVGWRLASAYWGRAYATEGALAALEFGFGHLGLREIVSFTAAGHVRSRRVMERLGMTHRDADDFEHPAIEAGHSLRRHVLYRRVRA